MQVLSLNLWPMLVGAVTVMATILGIAVWQRRQRRLRGERPPNTRKLLRPPGHTLSIKLENCQEKLLITLVLPVGGGAVLARQIATLSAVFLNHDARAWIAANGWHRTLLSPQLLPVMIAHGLLLAGGVCAVTWGVVHCVGLMREMRFLHLGLRGEQAVAEALVEVAAQGYRSFHDFPGGENWNIDHVVVGPGGVFAIETKTRSKRKAPPGKRDQEVRYDGIILHFPWGDDRNSVEQAKRNAKDLAGFLSKATGMKVTAKPVLVLPGWYVAPLSNPLEHVVRAMPETVLANYLLDFPCFLSDQQIQQIAFQVDQKCRDVEF